QEFLERKFSKRVPPQTQTGCGRAPSLYAKDEEALALQFGPDEVFFLSFNLPIEGRAIRTGHSGCKYRHDAACVKVRPITGMSAYRVDAPLSAPTPDMGRSSGNHRAWPLTILLS